MIYPQLSSGALSQFPTRKRRQTRTVVNRTADGRVIKLPDVAAQATEWNLQYAGLSDIELATLQDFFEAMEGSLNGFTFLDPCGNLFAWSDDLSQTEWQKDPFLTVTSGVSDPSGGQDAWQLSNSGGAIQGISQILNAPGGYVYCLSVYARAAQPTTFGLQLAGLSIQATADTNWNRFTLTGTGEASSASVTFGFQLAAGAAIDLYGPQAEPQESASVYQHSTTGGVYENAHFSDDAFRYTSTDVNRHSVTLNIRYANHL